MEPHGKPPAPPPSAAEIEMLAARAGLHLNAGQMADLAIAWRYAVQIVAQIPRDKTLADDFAFSFRLSLPAAGAAPRAGRKTAPGKATSGKAAPGKTTSAKTTSGRAKPAPARRTKRGK